MKLAEAAREALNEKKGENTVLLDVSKLSGVTDYFLISSGNSGPHIKALAEEVHRSLKKQGTHCYRRAGTQESEWMALDYVDVVVHVFTPEARERYGLEELWSDAPSVTT